MAKNQMNSKRKLFLFLFLICTVVVLSAQDTMYVHQTGGDLVKIATSEIDSIVFYDPAAVILPEIQLPEITTSEVTSVTQTTATSGGNILSDGGTETTARGVCWSIEVNPDTTDYKTFDGTGTGSFISSLTGLAANTTYYVRAYALNAAGVSYGEERMFVTMAAAAQGVEDVDGNVYDTLTIGTQVWFKQNLSTTRYNDDSAIPLVTDNTEWDGLDTPAYCWYNNDSAANAPVYGALYNWYAVSTTTNGGKNVCPAGWHVPTDAEWTILTDYLTNNGFGYEGSGDDIAKSMADTSGWIESTTPDAPGNNQSTNNSSGFTIVPGGDRRGDGAFYGLSSNAIFWSGTGVSAPDAWYRYLYYYDAYAYRSNSHKIYGYSVRCVRD